MSVLSIQIPVHPTAHIAVLAITQARLNLFASLLLYSSLDGGCTTYPDNLFQCATVLTVGRVSIMADLNLAAI